MPPKRTVTLGQDSPPFADSDFLFLSRETTNRHASGLAASSVGAALALAQACGDACDRLLYVSAHISAQCGQQAEAPQSVFAHWRSAEAWYRDDPSVTRRPRGQTRLRFDRPDQSSTRRYRRFTWFVLPSSWACVLNLFAWGSGVGSAGVQPTRNTQADGAPKVPGAGGTISGAVCLSVPQPSPDVACRPPDLMPQASSPCACSTSSANPPTWLLPGSHPVPGISTTR